MSRAGCILQRWSRSRVFVYLGVRYLLLLFLLPSIAFGQATAIPDTAFEQAFVWVLDEQPRVHMAKVLKQ